MRPVVVIFGLLILTGCDRLGLESFNRSTNHQGRYRTVGQDETLFAIAEEEYGNGLMWTEIRRFNPWVRPNHLQKGDRIYIPPTDSEWTKESLNPGTERGPPGKIAKKEKKKKKDRRTRSHNKSQRMWDAPKKMWGEFSSRKLFGVPLPRLSILALCGVLSHSFVQSILVWLAAIFTFVRDASFKKSMKAVFLTEILTFATLLVLGLLAMFMIYLASPEASNSKQLLASLEDYVGNKSGIAAAGLLVLAIYCVLSLRFYPQILGIRSRQAMPVLILAVLLPHALVLFLVGQRLGIVPS